MMPNTEDSPRLTQAENIAAYERIAAFTLANPVGCCLHVVLDDGNLDNDSVAFCQRWARNKGHDECIAVADLLARMSRTQRTKAYRNT
jgi:hypothetical protein